ncbi:MAG: helix-turn-helix transcriptional regulator [Balneolaceae bacterium]|nr:helix-turn-helix transcriptional regulator [Balneolaceae bacterium]
MNIWTLLISYGSLQGLFLAVVMIMREKSVYLGLFFLNVSYLLFIYLFERFEWFRDYPHLIWTNVPSWFLIGPLFFLFVAGLFESDRKTAGIKTGLHFLPAVAAFIFVSDFYFGLTGSEKVALFTSFYAGERVVDYVQMLYLAQIGAYLVAGYRVIHGHTDMLNDELSNSDIIHLRMIQKLVVGIGTYIILAILLSVLLSSAYPDLLQYFQFVFAALASTVVITTAYALYYSTLPHQLAVQAIPGSGLRQDNPKATMEKEQDPAKYASSSLTKRDLREILVQIEQFMDKEEPFRKRDLKIGDLAGDMDIPAHHISQCLNQELGKNFFEFINSYRVEAVKKQLQRGRHRHLTLLAIARECGFNSQSSFYRIFRQMTGSTPSDYIETHVSD